MEFKCSGCEYKSKYKINVQKHINNKNKCIENATIISLNIDMKCEYCNKSYSTTANLQRHHKTCKIKQETDSLKNIKKEYDIMKQKYEILIQNHDLLNKELDKLKYDHDILKYEYDKLKKEQENIKNNQINNIQNIKNIKNIQNNITINLCSYRSPNLEGMDHYFLLAIQKSLPTIIDKKSL